MLGRLLDDVQAMIGQQKQARMRALMAITTHSHIPEVSVDVLRDLLRVLCCRPILVLFRPQSPEVNTEIKQLCATFPDVCARELKEVCSF